MTQLDISVGVWLHWTHETEPRVFEKEQTGHAHSSSTLPCKVGLSSATVGRRVLFDLLIRVVY